MVTTDIILMFNTYNDTVSNKWVNDLTAYILTVHRTVQPTYGSTMSVSMLGVLLCAICIVITEICQISSHMNHGKVADCSS